MTMTVYRSTDPGAPPLRGYTPGDVINLLNKCLVTGYGSLPAAGWTMPFTGTNKAAFKQGAGSNGMYLRIDDTDATATTARYSRAVGYEAMSDVDTGTPNSFPTTVQQANGVRIFTFGAGTAANARPWKLFADSKRFIFHWSTNDAIGFTTANIYPRTFVFGDLLGVAGDAYNTFIRGDSSSIGSGSGSTGLFFNSNNATNNASYFARAVTGLGGSIAADFIVESALGAASPAAWANGQLSYPNAADGALYMSRLTQFTPGQGVRGVFPGLWSPLVKMASYINAGDTVPGTGDLAGRTFEFVCQYDGAGTYGALVEISNTWET